MDHMNESTENSLRQFEHIEREITARNNADSSNHQAARIAIEELQELQQQRLNLMLKHNDENGPQMAKQQNPPFTPLDNNATRFSANPRAGSSNEPAETEETEQISAATVQSPNSNFLASSNSSTPLNNIPEEEDLLLMQRPFRRNSASKTPSSLFGPLNVPNFKQAELLPPPAKQQQAQIAATSDNNSRPMFQSTPQQQVGALHGTMAGTKRKSNNLYTPGGRPVSPIAEEGREDLEVVDIAKMCEDGGNKLVQKLITQLRDLIAQWDWAQARHRHVAKIYFERQQEELNTGWEKFHEEMAKFNQQKTDEWARIAGIRSGLQNERTKVMSKKDADRIKELESEVEKMKGKELWNAQKMSELRIKIRELEGEVSVREKSYNEHMIKIRKCEQQLVKTEQENSKLRAKLTILRANQQKEQQEQNAQNKPQQSNPGPRATLFNLYNSGSRTNSSSTGSTSNAFAPNNPLPNEQPFIRRNNSDSTCVQHIHPPGSGRMHRSNSENGAAIQQADRPRVRFADDNLIKQPKNGPQPQFSLSATTSPSAFDCEIAALNKRFDIPAGMTNTMYQMTGRGREYTFTDGLQRVVVTELLACQQPPFCRQCLLYEYPLAGGAKNFRWVSGPLTNIGQAQNKAKRAQVEYRHEERLYELRTSLGNIVRYLLEEGQLELYWANGDRTFVLANGERREVYSPTSHDSRMEIYLPTGVAYRMGASTQWQREEFVPDTGRMAVRPDGSYSTLIVQSLNGNNQANGRQITNRRGNQQEMMLEDLLRRFNGTHAMKMALEEPSVPGSSLQLWLCMDNVLLVKHIQHIQQWDNQAADSASSSNQQAVDGMQREKRICFSRGQCRHIRTSPPMNDSNGNRN